MTPSTLTEAANLNRSLNSFLPQHERLATSRVVPYRETYKNSTARIESPIEHLQRSVMDEEKHRSSRINKAPIDPGRV